MNIHPTSIVSKNAHLERGVVVGPYTIIHDDVVIKEKTEIGSSVEIFRGSEIGSNCQIHKGAVIGEDPQKQNPFFPERVSLCRFGSPAVGGFRIFSQVSVSLGHLFLSIGSTSNNDCHRRTLSVAADSTSGAAENRPG